MKGLCPGEIGLFQNGLLAAIYAALTLCLAPLSYGPIQVRISECLTLLAFYDKRWVPGLTIGCLMANLNSPFGIADMVIGPVYVPGCIPHALVSQCVGGLPASSSKQRTAHRR